MNFIGIDSCINRFTCCYRTGQSKAEDRNDHEVKIFNLSEVNKTQTIIHRLSLFTETDRYKYIQEKSGLFAQDFSKSPGMAKAHGFRVANGGLNPSREVLDSLQNSIL